MVAKPSEMKKFQVSSLGRRSKVIIVLICFADILAGMSFSILVPFYPEEAARKGATEIVTALVFGSFQLVGFISSLFYGSCMLRIGPKFLFVSGIVVAGTCNILFGTLSKCPSGSPFIAMCFACRSVEALGTSAFMMAGFAILSSEFPQHISTMFGMTESAMAIGLTVGPTLGGVLYDVGGFGLPFFVIGGIIFVCGLIIYFILPSPQDFQDKRQTSVFVLLRRAIVWEGLQTTFVAIIGYSFLEPIFSTYLRQFGFSPSLIGLTFVILPCLYGLTSGIWGYIVDKKMIHGTLIIAGKIVCGCGFLLIGPSSLLSFMPVQLWPTIVGLAIFGLSVGSVFITPIQCLLTGASELGFERNIETFGMINGLFNAAMSMGAFIGPTLSGALVQVGDFRLATSVMAGIFFFSCVLSSLYFFQRYARRWFAGRGGRSQEDVKRLEDSVNLTEYSPVLKSKKDCIP